MVLRILGICRNISGFRIPVLLGSVIVFLSVSLHAGDDERDTLVDYESIWNFANLYTDPENPVLQKLALTGRAHFDYANLQSDQGDYEDTGERRFRVGFKADIFTNFALKTEVEFDMNSADPFYEKMTDAYLQWKPDSKVTVKVGKQRAKFTLDGDTSTNDLYTIDRNNVANNIWYPTVFVPGAMVEYRNEEWFTAAGIFSGGSFSKEFGNFDGSGFLLLRAGYDFAKKLEVEKALLSLDYVYQDFDDKNTFLRPNQHVTSLNYRYDTGSWGFSSEVAASNGYGAQGDLVGVILMPFVDLCENLQLVGRYTYLDSSDANGIRLNTYENRIERGRGDQYHEFYLGLNRYFYGHKLKLQTGVQTVDMRDAANDGGAYDGWGVTTGLRISW